MTRNLGSTSLHRKRRSADPMRSYDALPAPLRNWLAQATLPWSPASARRVWNRACAKGLSAEEALTTLSQAEARTLARDRFANTNHLPTNT
ncbi:conserved hypothetical protein [Dinoroseobacter shibae DFL 12 = DSM 16493]|uniref:Uncharacterized protein n=1 Tax=Dinoroseobacter shibae (strain DSM 16493 / NCIMB 14021 / DFL 12) TaxID=398580 RepID=A8LHZ3_DINSH|nr:DUF6525 family protein [Dinoroseobacter shibae]ABV94327.1 conserved hypothetical protein [Dinoroseobacter shibae DFL 12 = DSM 16493]URF45759.1 DUF6525 family protein [Dinoroseobacter shibae]URF50064.1 DUF6525 family protein [Dinoroseobacter shibae]